MFFMHHLVGVRPSKNELTIRPRLLTSMNNVKTSLTLRGQKIEIALRRTGEKPAATVDGKQIPLVNGELRLPLPRKALKIEINL
jgi:cellobiose phosphorylase